MENNTKHPAAAPSAQQAAGSIDTPEFWALLNERDEGAMSDAHAEELEQAIIAHIHAWAAATSAQPIAPQIQQIALEHIATGSTGDPLSEARRALVASGAWTSEQFDQVAQPIAVSAPTDERDLVDVATGVMCDLNMLDNYDEHETDKFCTALEKAFIAARAAAPVDAMTDKLLTIIAYAYQVAGAHDAPDHILDVLANPEEATDEQIEAMLPYVVAPVSGPSDAYQALVDAHRREFPSAAPVSGQGASIGDDLKFGELLIECAESYAVGGKKLMTAMKAIIAHIDSRPRSSEVSGQGVSIGDDAEFRARRYRNCLERVLHCHPSDRKHWRAAAEDALQNLPVTGSIRDDMGFVKVLCDYNSARVADTGGDVETEYTALVTYIDSRPRSEDSRAKVLLDPDEGVAVARLRALASTTPQKADDEN